LSYLLLIFFFMMLVAKQMDKKGLGE